MVMVCQAGHTTEFKDDDLRAHMNVKCKECGQDMTPVIERLECEG